MPLADLIRWHYTGLLHGATIKSWYTINIAHELTSRIGCSGCEAVSRKWGFNTPISVFPPQRSTCTNRHYVSKWILGLAVEREKTVTCDMRDATQLRQDSALDICLLALLQTIQQCRALARAGHWTNLTGPSFQWPLSCWSTDFVLVHHVFVLPVLFAPVVLANQIMDHACSSLDLLSLSSWLTCRHYRSDHCRLVTRANVSKEPRLLIPCIDISPD